MQRVGVMDQQFNITGTELLTCQSVCQQGMFVAYGICQNIIVHSMLVNFTQICQENYIFDSLSNQCLCVKGYYYNGSTCVNINNEFSKITSNMISLDSDIKSSNQELKSLFYNLNVDIQTNISNLNDLVTEMYVNLKQDISTQNASIHSQLNDIKTDMDSNFQNGFDQNKIIQIQIGDLKTETIQSFQYLNNNLTKTMNDNQINITHQVDYLKSQISQLSDKIDQVSVGGCPLNSTLVNGVCTCLISGQVLRNGICFCFASGATIVAGVCTCPAGQQMIDDICQNVVIFNGTNTDSTFQCSASVYTTTFDILTITNQVTTQNNFSRGYVFGITNIIQNGFISISDNVYVVVQPIFQFQNTFTNIKIQIGNQIIKSRGGALLTSLTTININQVNIISKDGSQITVNSELMIIAGSLINSSINNLLVNLSFKMSNGYIYLIGKISQQFQLTGYQILGTYQSIQTVAMLCFDISSATVYINQLSFKPSIYQVGNCSSYLISQISYSQYTSTITVSNIAIILGNSSSSAQTIVSDLIFSLYQFGGIIYNINDTSAVITINNVISECYQNITVDVNIFGILVGLIQSNSSNLNVINVCLFNNITGSRSIKNSGLIGSNINGNISLHQLSISAFLQQSSLQNFGLIGQIMYSKFNEVIDTKISMMVQSVISFGCIFGNMINSLFIIQNSSVGNSSVMTKSYYVGGFIGYVQSENSLNYTQIINNSIISHSNISANTGCSYVGGFLGWTRQNTLIILMNSKIQYVRLDSTIYSNFGLISGYNDQEEIQMKFINSTSIQVYVNNNLRDCAVIRNNKYGC
ncbi:Hypothetical_protein [Hexamita inflata]|uniref:Hypothetical_protein n=1 Tax=Hexamita inflata TaxID=28002 RepID=A0AA86RAX8_9EUKA|nr:Hypothetical protein HINF_LOCUS57262 [Hexamita inflata]